MPSLARNPLTLGLTAAALTFFPLSAQAADCSVGSAADYASLALAKTSCAIGGFTVEWDSWSNADPSVLVTPVSGVDAMGTYFGFRTERVTGAPVWSASAKASDQRPLGTPGFLDRGLTSVGLFWGFNHLYGPTLITGTRLLLTGMTSSSASQPLVGPTDDANGNPDPTTGCGWSINGVDAENRCAGFAGQSNNWIWGSASSGNLFDVISWGDDASNGDHFGNPETRNAFCTLNGAGQPTTSSCDASYQPFPAGVSMGSMVYGGSLMTAETVQCGNDSNGNVILCPVWTDGLADYNASGSVGTYEARVYVSRVVVTPEPSSLALLSVAGLGLALVARKRRTR